MVVYGSEYLKKTLEEWLAFRKEVGMEVNSVLLLFSFGFLFF